MDLIGRPQYFFSPYISDFKYNSESCHLQKFWDNTAIEVCIRNGQEGEYKSLVKEFVTWLIYIWTPSRPKRWWWTTLTTNINEGVSVKMSTYI